MSNVLNQVLNALEIGCIRVPSFYPGVHRFRRNAPHCLRDKCYFEVEIRRGMGAEDLYIWCYIADPNYLYGDYDPNLYPTWDAFPIYKGLIHTCGAVLDNPTHVIDKIFHYTTIAGAGDKIPREHIDGVLEFNKRRG